MSKILITGSSSGLGRELFNKLTADGHEVFGYSLPDYDVRKPNVSQFTELDVLINCAGVNRINWCEDVTPEEWDHVQDVNVRGMFFMTQACLPLLIESRGTVLNVVSNAAHMPMTCSAAYNASKGAALILTKQLHRELFRRHGITVFSVSPNKLKGTAMSNSIDQQVVRTRGWTLEEAQRYQLSNMPVGEETPPSAVAEFVAFLLSSKERHKYLSGCDLPYGA